MAEFIIQSAVKEQLANQNVSSDFYDALDGEVEELLAEAAQRAADNDRKTVQSRDL
jgi:histone H3/H4